MKLTKAEIANFKSIENSGEFAVDQVTCLVGKNEAGKTAVLDALYKINPVETNKAQFTQFEFPRRRIKRDYEGDEWKNEDAVKTTWNVDQSDRVAAVARFGFDPFHNAQVNVWKGYDNGLRIGVSLNEPAAIAHHLKSLTPAEREPVQGHTSIASVVQTLQKLASPTEKQKASVELLAKDFPEADITKELRSFVTARIPKIIKFSEYYRLPGRIAINEIRQKIAQNQTTFNERVFMALLDLAGTSIDGITNVQKTEQLFMELEAISNQLTDEIFAYWTTNSQLSVKFDIREGRPGDVAPFNSGLVFHTRIDNARHRASVEFDERSSGFIWFFSFLVWFSQVKKNYGNNLLILLDEPGLTLHGRAQADLLRYFNEKLRPKHQLIYTTHSPFMIDPEHLLSVRTVEDRSEGTNVLGTKVECQSLAVERDTVLPILGALGIDITQTLFVGRHTILVEGPSDLLYMKWFSRRLKASGRAGLDPRWTISPVGGLNKIASFVTLFSTQQLNIAVFTDYHSGEKSEVERLRAGDLLKKGHVLSAEMYTGAREGDIEDLIGMGLYRNLINKTYGLSGKNMLSPAPTVIAAARATTQVEEHFRLLPPSMAEFNHYDPAVFLVENGNEFADVAEMSEALDRFERLFQDFNALLPKVESVAA